MSDTPADRSSPPLLLFPGQLSRSAALNLFGYEQCDDCDSEEGIDRHHCIQCDDCFDDDGPDTTWSGTEY